MTYSSLSVSQRGCLLALVTFILILYIYCLVKMLEHGRYMVDIVIVAIMTMVAFTVFQVMVMYQQGDLEGLDIQARILALILIFLLSYVIFLHYNIAKWHSEHLSGMSVKEAFDKLPAGLMFYGGSGIPIMVNETMDRLSRNALGDPVTDGRIFWEKLKESTREGVKEDEDYVIVKARDGGVYGVTRSILNIRGHEVFELTAIDISREYELTEEYEMKRDQARILNTRLKALMGTIEYVTMNKELLQLKAALHDNIGQSILIAKRYLYAPGSVEKKRMLDFWSDNIGHLTNDDPEEWELPYYVISKEADRLGIRLDIIGDLPDDPELIPVVDAAISVHIGNTLKHADGTGATVLARKTGSHYVISFTNGGKPTGERIVERGGLSNLRREVEAVGGRMEVLSSPYYILRVILPEKVKKI
ncbi:MAG: hypothetical protein K5857_06310 [Lachnospiraceae bacterium]|nr:hypothetical protein [Lachnospiraceae bacterium]